VFQPTLSSELVIELGVKNKQLVLTVFALNKKAYKPSAIDVSSTSAFLSNSVIGGSAFSGSILNGATNERSPSLASMTNGITTAGLSLSQQALNTSLSLTSASSSASSQISTGVVPSTPSTLPSSATSSSSHPNIIVPTLVSTSAMAMIGSSASVVSNSMGGFTATTTTTSGGVPSSAADASGSLIGHTFKFSNPGSIVEVVDQCEVQMTAPNLEYAFLYLDEAYSLTNDLIDKIVVLL